MNIKKTKQYVSTVGSQLPLVHSIYRILPIFIIIGVWEAISGTLVPEALLPPFSDVLSEFAWLAQSEDLFPYLLDTLFRGLTGIVIAIVLGTVIGLSMSQSDLIRRNLNPVVSLTYPSPKSPLIPLLIFWLGIGHLSRIVLAVIGGLLPIVISTVNAADNIDEELIWSARTMGLSKFEETYKVILPASLPSILTGVRIGMIFAFVIVISSEMIAARSGIGVMIVEFGQFGQYSRVFAAVMWGILVVVTIDRLFLKLSDYLLRWSDQGVEGI